MEYPSTRGIKQSTTRDSCTFMVNISERDIAIASSVCITVISCSLTNLRMSSTSWVQRWIMSPV